MFANYPELLALWVFYSYEAFSIPMKGVQIGALKVEYYPLN